MTEIKYATTHEEKHDLFAGIDTHIKTEQVRLAIDPAYITEYTSVYGDPAVIPPAAGTYLHWYPLYAAKKTKRTTEVKDFFIEAEANVEAVIKKIVRDIPESKWTPADRLIFQRKTGDYDPPTHKTEPIHEHCTARPTPEGKGKIKLRCYTTSDASRASLPESAFGVEARWRIIDPVALAADDSDTSSKIKKAVAPAPADFKEKEVFFGATFILEAGEEFSGCTIQIFLRWRHKELNLSGPFGEMITTMVP